MNKIIVRNEIEKLLEDFQKDGGKITICKPGKKLKANSTFSKTRTGVAYVERARSLKKERVPRKNKG